MKFVPEKYPNWEILVPSLLVAFIVVVLLIFWYLDKFEGVDFKYDIIALSNFSLKYSKRASFGPNLGFFIFAQRFSF